MGATDAERQRRHRLHRAGNHALCVDGRDCVNPDDSVTGSVTRDDVLLPPIGLRSRGRRLWRQLAEGKDPAPMEVLLIEEACRLADRLDKLDAILAGRDRAWVKLEFADDGVTVEVVVDKVLSEARQQQLALKQILAELRQVAGKSGGRQQEGSIVDQLAAARARRLADASSS